MLPGQISALIVVHQHLIDRHLAQITIDDHARHPGLEDALHRIVAVHRRDQSRGGQNETIDPLGQQDVDVGLLLDGERSELQRMTL